MFAYKMLELVKLAYKGLTTAVQGTIAKDYYMKGLNTDMPIALKSSPDFTTKELKDLAQEITRLEIAGIKAGVATTRVNVIAEPHAEIKGTREIIDDIVNKVFDKSKFSDVNAVTSRSEDINTVNHGGTVYGSNNRQSRGRGRYRGSYRDNFTPRSSPQNDMKCRSCHGTGHLFPNCPVRFCQA